MRAKNGESGAGKKYGESSSSRRWRPPGCWTARWAGVRAEAFDALPPGCCCECRRVRELEPEAVAVAAVTRSRNERRVEACAGLVATNVRPSVSIALCTHPSAGAKFSSRASDDDEVDAAAEVPALPLSSTRRAARR